MQLDRTLVISTWLKRLAKALDKAMRDIRRGIIDGFDRLWYG